MIREYQPERDRALVGVWWLERGWPCPPECLPVCGVIVSQEGEERAAGWLYLDNSTPVAWIAWLVTKPEISGRQARRALDELIEALCGIARSQGRARIFFSSARASMTTFMQTHGFSVGDEQTTHLIKEI
ncbi:hypothetical protein Rhal01_03437 [Rubritalea halochordaticola]|uniref:N-acetyltransferase domain-containing protein n=1 Tax=Rubritalea halochordaticola TaxID=714537 RepID=A0ABP9V5S8_9BACT